jgi:uncharacterized protein YggE
MKRLIAGATILLIGAAVISVVFLLITGAVQSRGIALGSPDTALNDRMAQILYGAPANGISVNGEGLVKAKPDVAQTTIAVDVTNADPIAAQRDAATRMDKVIAKLKEMGVAADDIKTNQYSLTPQYNYTQNKETPTLVGYRVVNSVAVTIKQLDKVGQILDAAATAGATSLQGVTFTIADPTAVQSQARVAAVKQARARAEELARAAGASLGKVTSINESTAGATPQYAPSVSRSAAMGVTDTPIVSGELEVRVNVQMTYAIQ